MAKKKHAKAAKAAPSKKEKSSSMGWVIAAIIVIVVIALLALKGCVPASTQKGDQQTQPTEKGGLAAASAPDFDKKCTIAGGTIPGSKQISGDSLTVKYINSGRTANEGTYFEFESVDGKQVYRKNTDALQPQETTTYTVNLAEVASELGSAVKAFTIFPIQSGKACLNQPAYVIK